MFNNVPTPVLS